MASEIQGYLVKGTWRGEGGPCDVYAYWWTLFGPAGEVQWCDDRARATERGRLLYPTVNEADAARSKSSHLSDVGIFRVYADGREERLPDLEEALAEIERLRQENVDDRGMHDAQLANVAHERDEAREWVRRITQEQRVLTCAFCGAEYPPGTSESNDGALTAHVRVCPKHPMREVERERDAALSRVGMSKEEARRVAHACFAFNVGANRQDDPPTYGLTDTLIAAFRAIAAGVRPPTEGGDWIEPLCEWWPGLGRRDTVDTTLKDGT